VLCVVAQDELGRAAVDGRLHFLVQRRLTPPLGHALDAEARQLALFPKGHRGVMRAADERREVGIAGEVHRMGVGAPGGGERDAVLYLTPRP